MPKEITASTWQAAVPETEGKVVFSKEFSVPGMSQDDIYLRMQQWMDNRLAQNENNSRVVFTNKEKGQIVGMGVEWIVFNSTALSLDRTKILYQLSATCRKEKCTLKVEKIRFIYREGKEKYSAEEWISDKYALNKSKTKLVRGLAKWRIKTVDFVDNLYDGIIGALNIPTAQAKTPTASTPSGTTTKVTPKTSGQVLSATYKEIAPDAIPANAIQTGNGKLVIAIGEEPSTTLMTANAGGSLGKIAGNKPVIFTILSPEQPYAQLETADNYTVRFYPNGSKEPTIIMECRKIPTQTAIEGMPRTYIGEILKAKVKQ